MRPLSYWSEEPREHSAKKLCQEAMSLLKETLEARGLISSSGEEYGKFDVEGEGGRDIV